MKEDLIFAGLLLLFITYFAIWITTLATTIQRKQWWWFIATLIFSPIYILYWITTRKLKKPKQKV